MIDKFDLIVIGAGASGFTAAITAAERGARVLLLEKSDRPGRKILASGNGRCNLMNVSDPQYPGNPGFAETVLRQVGPRELKDFFHCCGLIVREEDEGRVYPVTNQASSVLSALKTQAESFGCVIKTNQPVVHIHGGSGIFSVTVRSGEEYTAGNILVACGGASQPKLGGTDDGYRLLEELGHSCVPVRPSLVPVSADARSISGLSGIRAKCTVILINKDGEEKCRKKGEILFTDYGVSGICVMQCARQIVGTDDRFEIDFLDPVFKDREEARNEIIGRLNRFADRESIFLLSGILVPKLAFAVLKQAEIPMRGERIRDLRGDIAEKVLYAASRYRISHLRPRGLDQAQVTAGGVSCDEFDAKTMESRLVPGVYAAGEVLDVDGDCGGYNLMFAFASGITAGKHVVREEI